MIKIFTKDERKIILFFISFFLLGLIIVNAQNFLNIKKSNETVADSVKIIIEKSHTISKINLNEADIETLSELPGIGPVKSKIIFDYREQNGEFKSLIDLTKVKGIGKKTLAKLLPHLEMIGDSAKVKSYLSGVLITENSQIIGKINLNTATIFELTSLKGIGEKKAELIIKYRKENGNFKTIGEIQNVKGIGKKIFQQNKDKITIKNEKK